MEVSPIIASQSQSCLADFMGGDLMLGTSISLNFLVPFDMTRSLNLQGRVFANAGNLVSLHGNSRRSGTCALTFTDGSSRRTQVSRLFQDIRTSVGFGIAMPLMGGRLELNYSIPWRNLPGDSTTRFQWGLGLDFL